MPSEFLPISTSAADAEYDGVSAWDATGAAVRLGDGYSAWWQFACSVPAGATLYQAVLELTPAATGAAGTLCTLDLMAAFVGDLATDRSAVLADGAGVTWTFGAAWAADVAAPASRVDVTTLVNRFLARTGYAPGAVMTLRASAGDLDTPRAAHAADGDGQAARLLLRWYHGTAGLVALRLEDLFADAGALRSGISAADRMEALARVHTAAFPSDAPRPLVLLEPLGDDFQRPLIATNRRSASGSVGGRIVVEVDEAVLGGGGSMTAESKRLAVNAAADWADAVLGDVAALGEGPGYLAVGNASASGRPTFLDRDKRAVRQAADQAIDVGIPFRITFGTQGA